MLHASGVSADNVVLASGIHASFGVPLYLRRTSIEHGTRKDAENRRLRVQHTVLQYGTVLHDSLLQRDIIGLHLSANLMNDENRVLVAHLQQLLAAGGHEKCVTVVNGVSELEEEDAVGVALLIFLLQLLRSQSVLIKAIIVLEPLEHLEIAANKPVTARVDVVDVRMAPICQTECTSGPLLLVIPVNLAVAHDGNDIAVLSAKGDRSRLFNLRLVSIVDRKRDGHRHVDHGSVRLTNAVEVSHLQELVLAHEALHWVSPTLREYVHPLLLDLIQGDLIHRLGFLLA
mmetsp:Transcript_9295/g.27989  ORF Transcript_9295/g.27989 Transcript_9295/m.27989 type:complete len:287 (-) Transcript_9295:310-1170(-)